MDKERFVDYIEVKVQPSPYREHLPPRITVRTRINGMEVTTEKYFYDDALVSQFDRMLEIAGHEVKAQILALDK